MSIAIDADTFIESHRLPTIDVRSPGEFQKGHIPFAINVPLFTDAERAEVGTIYKQVGSESAIKRGYELVGVKTDQLVARVRDVANGPDVQVHCWRGGLRSEGFAGLLKEHGFNPKLLRGGYKAYRRAAHQCFADRRRIVILSGHTGAGKTQLLDTLKDAGQQVIDLERLACHRGSAFGGINQAAQPTCEQFENDLFLQWRDLDPNRTVWIEGESRSIGRTYIPQPVWDQMLTAPNVFVQVEREQRIEFLVKEYGDLPVEELGQAMQRIKKRLGGDRLQTALDALGQNDLRTFAGIALDYYDRAYTNSLVKYPREVLHELALSKAGEIDSIERLCKIGDDLTAS